jgi:phage terminase large subunit
VSRLPTPSPLEDYLSLRTVWRTAPRLYVAQRFGIQPTWQQAQILDAVAPDGAKVSVRSGHGTGKSACAAWTICWYVETHDFALVPCTAPSAHQLRDILWQELARWRRAADAVSAARDDPPRTWLSRLFTLNSERLFDPSAPDWGALARTASKERPEALQGFHAQHLLFIVDEASGVDEAIYEAAEGALSTPAARSLFLGNPTRNTGTFAASHKQSRGEYTTIHLRSQDSPLVDPQYRPRLVRKWGEGSNVVKVRSDGDFPSQEDDVLIPLEHVEPCLHREPPPGTGLRRLGVDVARYGADRTCLVLRQGAVVEHLVLYAKQGTMETVGRIVAVLRDWRVDEIDVDVIGVGAGVYDRLEELQRQGGVAWAVVAVNVAEKPPQAPVKGEPRPHRMRDYLWLEMARWLREEQPVFVAPERQACEDLAGELASVRYRPNSNGELDIEDKDAMKKRLGHSPDLADALGCTFAPPAHGKVVRAW